MELSNENDGKPEALCVLANEVLSSFQQCVRTASKIGNQVQITWDTFGNLTIYALDPSCVCYFVVKFNPDSFKKYEIKEEDDVTITVNAKKFYTACSLFPQAESVTMSKDKSLNFTIVNKAAVTSRRIELEQSGQENVLSGINENKDHYFECFGGPEVFYNGFSSFGTTEMIEVILGDDGLEFHTSAQTSKSTGPKISSHAVIEKNLFHNIDMKNNRVGYGQSYVEDEKVSLVVSFKYFKKIITLAKTLGVDIKLCLKDPKEAEDEEGGTVLVVFNYFRYFDVSSLMCAFYPHLQQLRNSGLNNPENESPSRKMVDVKSYDESAILDITSNSVVGFS